MRVPVLVFGLFFTGLSVLPGCGDDGGGFSQSIDGKLELDPNTPIGVSAGDVAIGASLQRTVTLTNVGNGPLDVTGIALTYDSAADDQGAAFVLVDLPAMPFTLDQFSGTTGLRQVVVTIQYTRQTAISNRQATVNITTTSKGTPTASVQVLEQEPLAVGSTSASLDFGTVENGTVSTRQLAVQNAGTDVLICSEFAMRGHPDFTLHVGDAAYPPSESTLQRAAFETPITVAPQDVVDLEVTFAPESEIPAEGEIVLFCNDFEGSTKGHTTALLANQNVPCIQVKPRVLEFGGKIVGQKAELPVSICSCSPAKLKIKGVALDPARTGPDFTATVSGPGVGIGIDPNAPLVLSFEDCVNATVTYVPDVVNPLDADKRPIPDVGVLIVTNDSFEAAVEVPITGIGLEGVCPVPIITVEEGEQVVPQTILHLDSTDSYSPNGAVTGREWSVVSGPTGNVSSFIPSAVFEKPVYEVNLAGLYTFQLGVRDEANKRSGELGCEFATYTVVVIPDEAIHVELAWTTPLDLDALEPGEGKGSDLDLHFAHPFATGAQSVNPDIDGDGIGDPWFDNTFDCFWHDPNPNWGAFDPQADDDPSLDRDDIDGWGPENLNLDVPEEGSTYHIGVHHWNDWGFGESVATIRVYIYGELDIEIADVPLAERDMWYVGTIPWLGGTGTTQVREKDGARDITPNYLNPAFVPPIDGD